MSNTPRADTGNDTGNDPGRLQLIRDIATLQVKLIVDGFRDLLLVPASMIVGIVSLFSGGDRTGQGFYDLLRLGKRSEKWINLFGAADRLDGDGAPDEGEDIDRIVQRVETFMVDEYRHGRLTAQARSKLEGVISRLQTAAERPRDEDQG